MTYDWLCLPFFSPLHISLIDVTNTLQIFYFKYMILMTKIIIIIIGLLVCNYFYFLFYIRLDSSPAEHENFRSKILLMGNSTKFFKIFFWDVLKTKYRINVVSIFQNHEFFLKEKSISNKWKFFLAINHFTLQHLFDMVQICLSQIPWKCEKPMLIWCLFNKCG